MGFSRENPPPAPGELFDGDLDVREAAAAVFVASQELEDVRSQLEAKEKESEDAIALPSTHFQVTYKRGQL